MTLAPLDPIDRAWWHLHLSPDLLYADMREQPACRAEPLEFDDDEIERLRAEVAGLRDFVEHVRRNGSTHLAGMAIAVLAALEVRHAE